MSLSKEYRIKHLFVKRIGGAWGVEPDENAKICLRAADIITDQFRHKLNDLTYRSFSFQELISRKLKQGDIIIEKSGGGENQPVGRVAKFVIEKEALCSNFLDLLRPNNEIVIPSFITYILYSLWKNRTVVKSIKQTTGIQNLDIEDYFNNKAKIPSLFEQNKIVNYLDKEIRKIDSLIEKKKKLIDLLEEKKKAVINQCVTRDLNSEDFLKNSGINWLGNVSENWRVERLKFLTSKVGSGVTPSGGAEVYTDEGILFLRSQNIYNDRLHLDDETYIPENIHNNMKSSQVKKGDILLNITGGSIGRCYYYNLEVEANINQHVCIIRVNDKIFYKYLHFVLISFVGQFQIDLLQYGGGREAVSFENIKNFWIPFPSFEQQKDIVDFIEKEFSKFDSIVNKVRKAKNLLKEKRTAIILEAINGELNL
ncbi:restriction endonuclease subunit S [Flavobacterium sp. CLA17]|uniref:restriction endonuclease subunit S n=1 Tax=Flavobacterium sp. CLA17 TaxID=2724135 RepID=UPI0014916D55|nr:restriction endonuclease subunit S [Flavobacterium sp. CLA17]QSB29088.1 restriction endonuclease subunit S [Flavobacterium sp. CLA17]